tara:strand:- start:24457 stop:25428 length:972 start_codon:yes stop_codon:yes gene_type:complete
MNNKIKIGLIGVGYWGKNILRNIVTSEKTQIACVCDKNVKLARQRLKEHNLLDKVRVYDSLINFYNHEDMDAVAIATPAGTHYELSKLSLENNKHVLVEKPMCFTTAEARKMVNLANKNNLTLMCDHTFCFSGTTNAVKKIVNSGELGNIISINSSRLNLGLFQKDTNVIWDLAPHDFSILQHILGNFEVKSQNVHVTKSPVSEFAAESHVFLQTKSNIQVTVYSSWISPVKERKLVVVGDKKMLVWDDLAEDKIKVYDKNVKKVNNKIEYYDNGFEVVNFDKTEPLLNMINHFADCIANGKESISSGEKSYQIVKILSEANE